MDHKDLIELRNKMIHLYQAVVLIESGKYDIIEGLTLLKDTSKSVIDVLDKEYYNTDEVVSPGIGGNNIVFSDSLVQDVLGFGEVETVFNPSKSDSLISVGERKRFRNLSSDNQSV